MVAHLYGTVTPLAHLLSKDYTVCIIVNLLTLPEEYAEVVVDFGGRVEELALLPVSTSGKKAGSPHQILLSHAGNATAIKENMWWKGMFLVPWANRIAYVSY